MKQEDKELLLKDLCARLPYKVKVEAKGLHKTIEDDYNNRNIIAHVLTGLNLRDSFKTYSIDYSDKIPLFNRRKGDCNIKPYLFPLSSMTEEQKRELKDLISQETKILIEQLKNDDCGIDEGKYHFIKDLELDWLIKNHFDYRGLIPMDLANNATGLNIY